MSTVRSIEIAVTKEFSGADPVWTNATIHTITDGTSQLSLPLLGDTKYAVRYRKQDVFGQFSEWSDHTEHTTVAGADSLTATTATAADLATNLLNGPATVTIDDDGLTVEDGALTLKDEFGSTVLVASGFSGAWQDFINTGLYNGRFTTGVAGTVANGRTASLPYWTLSDAAGSPVATYYTSGGLVANPGLRITFSALNDKKKIVSDPIRVASMDSLRASVRGNISRAAGTLRVKVYFEVDSDPSFSSPTSAALPVTYDGTSTESFEIECVEGAGSNNPYARIVIEVSEISSHNAANKVEIAECLLRPVDDHFTGIEIRADSGALGTLPQVSMNTESDAVVWMRDNGSDPALAVDSRQEWWDGGVKRAELDGATGEFTEYSDNTWTAYTPTVGGIGSGTNSTAQGYYQKIGKIVFVRIYLICNANGTGSNNVTITTPSEPDRTDGRQVLMGNSEGHAVAGSISLVALAGGSGATWDRVRSATGGNMIGTDYDNGGIITIQGWYREA